MDNSAAGDTGISRIASAHSVDLPLRALIFEDGAGKVWVARNDPRYIIRRHALPAALAVNLAAVAPLIEQAAQVSAR